MHANGPFLDSHFRTVPVHVCSRLRVRYSCAVPHQLTSLRCDRVGQLCTRATFCRAWKWRHCLHCCGTRCPMHALAHECAPSSRAVQRSEVGERPILLRRALLHALHTSLTAFVSACSDAAASQHARRATPLIPADRAQQQQKPKAGAPCRVPRLASSRSCCGGRCTAIAPRRQLRSSRPRATPQACAARRRAACTLTGAATHTARATLVRLTSKFNSGRTMRAMHACGPLC
jgi:hypothetical protein